MVYLYRYIYMPYVHLTESALTILQTRLKKGNGRLGNAIDTLDSQKMKKMAADSKTKRKKLVSTQGLA